MVSRLCHLTRKKMLPLPLIDTVQMPKCTAKCKPLVMIAFGSGTRLRSSLPLGGP